MINLYDSIRRYFTERFTKREERPHPVLTDADISPEFAERCRGFLREMKQYDSGLEKQTGKI